VRIGTFEFFANRGDVDGVRTLADYVIARHYPEAATAEQPYAALLNAVIDRVASLVARWMLIGFIHGVMNTDNMSIAARRSITVLRLHGFLPSCDGLQLDRHSWPLCYANQPHIAHWNLSRLAGALLPLLAVERDTGIAVAQAAIDRFPAQFGKAYSAGLSAKLGLFEMREGDAELAQDLLDRMAENKADFTLTFRGLSDGDAAVRMLFGDPTAFDVWAGKWGQRLLEEKVAPEHRRAAMRAVNPAFIPRNHRVQAAITAAQTGDFRC